MYNNISGEKKYIFNYSNNVLWRIGQGWFLLLNNKIIQSFKMLFSKVIVSQNLKMLYASLNVT